MRQVFIQESDFQRARNKIRLARKAGASSAEIIFSSDSDKLNRKVLEKEPIDILLINLKGRKDRMKQRDSGFNQVLAKIAKKHRIALGINLDEILSKDLKKKQKAELLARVQQNIKLAKKNKLKIRFISDKQPGKDKHDLRSLGMVLGMPTSMTKNL